MGKKGLDGADNYLNVWFGFKRNLPANILEEAQATAALKGFVSEKTRLSLLSFVDDPEYEEEEMQQDIRNSVNLDEVDISGQPQEISRAN